VSHRPSTLERITRAHESSDLSMDSWELNNLKDIDVLTATGMVARRTSLSASIMGLQSGGSVTALKRARESVVGLVRKLNIKRRWQLDEPAIVRVAELALVHHVSPACRHCHGRGYYVIHGTPTLSGRNCSHCKGSGVHPLPKRHKDQVGDVLSVLAHVDALTEHWVRKMLR